MAQGKTQGGADKGSAKKSRKPRFKGINHPKNMPKAFRSSGNTFLIKSYLGK